MSNAPSIDRDFADFIKSTLFDDATEAMALVNTAGQILAINSAYRRMFGAAVRDNALDDVERCFSSAKDWHDIVVPLQNVGEPSQNSIHGWRKIVAKRDNGPTFFAEARAWAGPATHHPVSAVTYLVAFREPRGPTIGTAIQTDERNVDPLARLTAGLTHDFNNVLAVIKGNVDLADVRNTDPRVASALREAELGCQMAARMVERLMTFGRGRRLQTERIDVGNRVVAVLKLAGHVAKVDAGQSKRSYLARLDGIEFENAILNVLNNAVDAIGSNGRIIITLDHVKATAPSQPGRNSVEQADYVRITIVDTGCGMSPVVLARAIEPYFSTKTARDRSGLGLSTVHGFFTQSGGFIDIASAPGVGTTVSLYAPRDGTGDDTAGGPSTATTFTVNI